MKKRALICGLGILAGLASVSAEAAVISFDPDGAGPLPAVQVGSFDLLPGNSLNKDVFVNPSSFPNLFQARVGALLDSNGNVIPVPGLNSTFEITVTAQFNLSATLAGPITTTVLDSASTAPNFVRFYYDSSINANDLLGTGFDNGTMILNGVATDASGVFLQSTAGPVAFDQFGPNNYPGVASLSGIGGSSVDAAVSSSDSSFFLDTPNLVGLNASTTNSMPYTKTDPSQQFFGGVIPNIGPVNGIPTGQNTDIQVETDAAVSFTVVPEPASLSLIGLSALGLLARRRRHA